ncbi:DUF2867 domain-containing protein [Salidesulfovibrio onnuriiensis]|uniref:DUF2867 domain-containing protein n=1 Tax=Salidesulfovibrio onnuriiensis TaxID=2583823 RepID=UPI0011CA2CBA|nr:DUF2867 domain-containing protein [Salidesulfovibrio onnuriiensis]
MSLDYSWTIPAFRERMAGADHVDSHDIEGDLPFKRQLVRAMNWAPAWVKFLYKVRKVVARVMGLEHDDAYGYQRFDEASFPMRPGEMAGPFEVVAAREDSFWMARAEDRHLAGYICMAVEELGQGRRKYHCTTIVCFRNWLGPVYFNLIRPFHHLIVRGMLRESVRRDS